MNGIGIVMGVLVPAVFGGWVCGRVEAMAYRSRFQEGGARATANVAISSRDPRYIQPLPRMRLLTAVRSSDGIPRDSRGNILN